MNFRKFSTIFSIIAIIFLTLSGTILAVDYWNKADIKHSPGSTILPTGSPDINDENSPFNILLLGSETKKGYTDVIIVANYDPQSNIVGLLSIPSNIKVPDNDNVIKLGSVYGKYGAENTADLLTNMFGIRFKYYLCFEYGAVKDIIDDVDGISYELNADLISDVASSGINIDLKRGKQTFDGLKSVQFLSFKKPTNNKYSPELLSFYDGSNYSRTKLLQSFFREFCVQKLKPDYIGKFESIFPKIKNKIDTNITADDISNLVKNARDVNVQVCRTYMLSGKDQNEGLYYFEYNNRIKETDSNREYNAAEIINTYFISPSFITHNN